MPIQSIHRYMVACKQTYKPITHLLIRSYTQWLAGTNLQWFCDVEMNIPIYIHTYMTYLISPGDQDHKQYSNWDAKQTNFYPILMITIFRTLFSLHKTCDARQYELQGTVLSKFVTFYCKFLSIYFCLLLSLFLAFHSRGNRERISHRVYGNSIVHLINNASTSSFVITIQ